MKNLHQAVKGFGVRVSKVRLLAFVAACNPEWTNDQLARVVGYTRTSLSRGVAKRAICQGRAAGGNARFHKGKISIDRDGGRTVEGVTDASDE